MEVEKLRKESNLGLNGIRIVGKNEIIAFFRSKGLVASQLLQPILYVVFIVVGLNNSIGSVNYNGLIVPYSNYTIVGIFSLLIVGQMTQVIYRVTIDKRYGLLALKLSSGVKPFYYILGMSLYSILGLGIQEIVIYLIGLLFNINISFPLFLYIMLLSFVVLLFWTSLGVLITMFINDYQKRDIVIRFLITPLGFTAPVFYLYDTALRVVQIFGAINPLSYQLAVLRDTFFGIQSSLQIFLLILASLLSIVVTAIIIPKINLVLVER